MAKIRVSDVAKECGKQPKLALEKALEMGLKVTAVSSGISEEEAGALLNFLTSGINPNPPQAKPKKDSKDAESSKAKTKKAKQDETIKDETIKDNKESSKKETKQEEAKEEIKAESSDENAKNNENSEKKQDSSLEDANVPQTPIKPMGLRIIRKNKVETPQVAPTKSTDKKSTISYKELLANTADESSESKKHKKDKKHKITQKHNDQKINLLDERELGFKEFDDEEDDEIVLFDLNEQEIRDEEKENQIRQAITDRVQIHRKNPWMNEGSIKRGGKKKKPPKAIKQNDKIQGSIVIPEEIRVYEFAEATKIELRDVIKVLFNLGVMATKNDFLDKDVIEILASEFELDISIQDVENASEIIESSKDSAMDLRERAPVVTIMGHVDHGKTSLLDYIRNSRIASGEAGGITQHIGAYSVSKNGKSISFIDTPGHEAFSAMRGRGAQITDIAIIVIAADDGVKQQTKEALNHAKAAGVQIIIAMNKMDKENANVDKLKAECAELGYTPNDWGGEYEFIPISAKTGQGIDTLLETILIQAEVLDLKANYSGSAKAVVLEASIEKGRGATATIIVQEGKLSIGDSVVAGTAYGRVRALIDDMGQNVKELYPSSVATITGLSEVPSAGALLQAVENDTIAREYAQKRHLYLRQKELSKSTKVTFDELGEMVAKGNLKILPLIIKADTQGSLEAIKGSLEKLNNDEIGINIIGSGVGGISESDIDIASASENSVILGFNVRPIGSVRAKAKELGVEIKTYSIIYALLDDIRALLSGLLSPVFEEENTGQAQVREIFSTKVGTIAGCMVVDGKIEKNISVRLIRDGVVIHTGSIASLKRFKDDVKEVAKGFECGIMLDGYNEIQVGDVFETFKQVAKKRTI